MAATQSAVAGAFMTVTGQRQGQIKGPVTQKGRVDQIKVLDLSYAVVSPRDPASGLPTGKRSHQPVQVTVPTSRQTAQMFDAAVNNENLTSIVIDFWFLNAVNSAGGSGAETKAFILKLTNANIAEFDLNMESGIPRTDLVDQYSFTFQKIELNWIPNGGISASDNWSAAAP
jgi:type VI secretion system secreted protein Hcp